MFNLKILIPAIALSLFAFTTLTGNAVSLPNPVVDTPVAKAAKTEKIVLAGGCFWGVQEVFKHVKGVTKAVSGYSGGTANTANYETVSSGLTKHAEAVEVTYDPSKVTVGQLLKVYFAVAHDPTQLNYQGPDHGTQYRSAIFYTDDEQKKVIQAYISQLNGAKAFKQPIVTQVVPLQAFYAAEAYHQDYAALHPNNPYIVMNDAPKVRNLQKELPDLWVK